MGNAVGFHSRRGIRVLLADGALWVGNAHLWKWLQPDEQPEAAELQKLPHGVPKLPPALAAGGGASPLAATSGGGGGGRGRALAVGTPPSLDGRCPRPSPHDLP